MRLKLVDLLKCLHSADRDAVWSSLCLRRKKKSAAHSDPQELDTLSPRQALVTMVNDGDHMIRMHVAKAITSLFVAPGDSTVSGGGCNPSRDGTVLLSRAAQEQTFEQVMEMLTLAHVVAYEGLDELSAEDESVSRVASRMYTLLMMGCVSPLCESMVVEELVMAVGRGQVDTDLVVKVQ